MASEETLNWLIPVAAITNGDYIRSLNNRELSVMLGVIIDEFTKSAISDPTYPYTLDEQIKAARKWLDEPVKHNGKMIKEICARIEDSK